MSISPELPSTAGLNVCIYRFPFDTGFNVHHREPITDYFNLLFIIQALTNFVPFVKGKPMTTILNHILSSYSIHVLGTYCLCTNY